MKTYQECEQELTQKGEMVERLQAKASSIGRILNSLEKKYNSTHGDETDIKKSPSGQLFSYHQPPNKRAHLRIQQIPPFNANRMKKSPSNEVAAQQQQEQQSTNVTNEVLTEEPVKNEE